MKKLVWMAVFAVAITLGASDALAQSACCAEATDGSSCIQDTLDISGCLEAGPACTGGTLDPGAGGPAGCICVGDTCTSDNCTDDAAAACCDGGQGNDCP